MSDLNKDTISSSNDTNENLQLKNNTEGKY